MRKTAVIGGGAAGMMAAIFGAYAGDDITVFEKNQKIGRKIYITGKGRCNLTNNCDVKTVIENTPVNARFLYSALNRFSPKDTMDFFESNGLSLKTERGNRVFPVSDRAADVVDTLLKVSRQAGCQIVNQTVSDIVIENGCIKGIKVKNEFLPFDKVIIACGGKSYPLTGSTGDGYIFAKKAGHNIISLKPSLVPLETVEKIPFECDKLLLKNISLNVVDTLTNKKLYTDFGEMQLMKYGVSGAVILSASSHMREMQSGRYRIDIDLKPALSEEKLDIRLLREISDRKLNDYEYLLHAFLPKQMIQFFIEKSGIPANKKCSEISRTDRKNIISLLKKFSLTVKSYRPLEEAIVTSGGVDVKEIEPKTMESKLVKGLYFAGEVINVDCYTGGFNLQIAWSTAYACAQAVEYTEE